MSDTKTVEMRFDNKDFESNARQSISTLEKLKSALKLDGASKGLDGIGQASKKLDFKDLGGAVDSVGKKFSVLETIATGALLRIGMQAADAGMKLVKSFTIDQVAAGWDKYAQKTTAVQTIMSNLQNDASKFVDEASKMDYVNEQIEKLNWFSDETSYSLTDMTSNIGKFVANGQGLEDSVTAMQGIATWAAMSGQNSQTAARAMYNISQAMGTGSMQIKDWMSIENANMATAQFKQMAIDIGVAQGKLKEGQVTIESFRESLAGKDTKGWFDKSVMMGTFKEYGSAVDRVRKYIEDYAAANDGLEISTYDAIQAIKSEDKTFADSLGFRAFAAAQEAKTLREAIDATYDAVSSKWMSIFELIFGNYLEQKQLWTDFANGLWEVFAAPLDNIRQILKVWNKGFDGISGRADLLGGIGDILNVFFHSYEEFDEAGNVIAEHISLLDSLKSAFAEVFGLDDGFKSLGKRLWDLTHRFKEFTKSLELLKDENIDKIKNSFKGLFTTLKIVGKTISAIIKPFAKLFGELFGKASSALLDMTSSFGEWVSGLYESLEASNFFENISTKISNAIESIRSAINNLSMSLTGMSFGELLGSIKGGVLKGLSSIIGMLEKLFFGIDTTGLGEKVKGIRNFFSNLSSVFSRVKSAFSDTEGPVFKIVSAIGRIFKKLGKVISDSLEKNGLFGLVKLALKAGIVLVLFKFLSSIAQVFNLFGKVGNLFEAITGVFEGIKKALKALAFKAIAEGIKDIALAVAILALSIIALGSMDRGELAQGLLALVALVGIIALLKQIVGGITGLSGLGAGAAFLAFGVTIMLLTAAVALLGNMDTDSLGQGIVAIALLTLIFGMFSGLTKTANGINLIAAAAAFALFGVAIDILAIGVFALGSMSTADLFQGVAAVAALTLIFAMFKKLCATTLGVNLIAAAAAFALFGVAIDILAIGVFALGSMSTADLAQGVAAVAALTLIFAMFKKLCTTVFGVDLIAAAAAFAIFGVAIDVLAIGVRVLGSMSTADLVQGVAAVAALTLIFAMFKKFCTTVTGINLIASAAAFALFGVAVDILTIGVVALGAMDTGRLTAAIVAVAALVAIFGVFKQFCATAVGIDLLAAIVAFGLFAVAVDIIALGVVALGQLDVGQITAGVAAIAAMVLLYGVLNMLSAGGASMPTSAIGFLAFSVAIVAVAAALNLMIPVMEAIQGMGDSWWQPLVFLGGALAILVAAGAVSGIPLVTAGLIALTAAVVGIGAACLLAGVGIFLAAEGFASLIDAVANLVSALGQYGPQAAASVGDMISAILSAIISSAPQMAVAAMVIIASLAAGLVGSAGVLAAAALVLIVTLLDTFSSGIEAVAVAAVNALAAGINAMAAAIRASGAVIIPAVGNLLSAIIGLVLDGIAALVALIPGVGPKLASSIRGWKGDVDEAITNAFSSAESLGAEGGEAVVSGFNGAAGDNRFKVAGEQAGKDVLDSAGEYLTDNAKSTGEKGGKELTDGMSESIDNNSPQVGDSSKGLMDLINKYVKDGSAEGADSFNLDFLSQMGGSIEGFDISSLMGGKMGDLSNAISNGGGDSDAAMQAVMALLNGDTESFDPGAMMQGKMSESTSAIQSGAEPAGQAAKNVADTAGSQLSSFNAYGSGKDMGNSYAAGIRSSQGAVVAAAKAIADAVNAILHFSEPDEGPLSDFHTYAPDMIKLWCKGIYDNLGQIEGSSESVADTVYDGFSTALDYVSDLIDNGMSDELSIRPVLDLSGIQNGMNSLDSMINNANGYTVTGTARLASVAASGVNSRIVDAASTSQEATGASVNNYNTFNITNDDPNTVAQKVSKILNQDARREQYVWAR